MSQRPDPIDANSLRIKLSGDYTFRKDVINRARQRWDTANKSKAVMRSAESFVDLVDELEALLKDPDVSDDLKNELVDRFDVKYLDLWYRSEAGLDLDQ